MITMLLYVLFSQVAFDFPIHTLPLSHSLALASQLTLCTPLASVLSGISTNSASSVSLPFAVLRNWCPETPVVRITQVLSTKTVHLKTVHEKSPNGTLMYLTMPRLLQLCLRFGRYLRPFGPDTTYMYMENIKIIGTFLLLFNLYFTIYPAGNLVNFSSFIAK